MKTNLNIGEVPATTIHATGVQSEAENFLAPNFDRNEISAIDKYWADVTAQDPVCLRVERVVQSAGCEIALKAGEGVPLGLRRTAAGALTRSVALYGDLATKQALLAVCAVWTKYPAVLRGILIVSLAKLIEGNQTIDIDHLARVLAGKAFAEIIAAEGLRNLTSGSAETALARTIGEIYNWAATSKIDIGGNA